MKSSRTPPFLKRSLFAFGFMLVLLGVTGCFFVVNTTRSFPLGVYFKTHGPVHKGDLVLFCPEENMVARYGRARGLISYGVCPGQVRLPDQACHGHRRRRGKPFRRRGVGKRDLPSQQPAAKSLSRFFGLVGPA